ncbi:hypothetical protein PUR71_15320 [Streptomyces sp. SP17BM10]|uniref:hypothetical protein n=1 Tax=Streptomyces sp. SP17BM10 TaxID=3002530 RepID=UPI002E783B86|nr:hypothetical protein [Streptomyces sp. SP17BM10]MEE1784257.1 hypothetical protein [Streptomyces sp. SP17BM10]
MAGSIRGSARAGALLRRAGWSAVALAAVVGTGTAAREFATADIRPLEVACEHAASAGHHRLAMRFCRGGMDRWKAPAGKPEPTGHHGAHGFLRFRLP